MQDFIIYKKDGIRRLRVEKNTEPPKAKALTEEGEIKLFEEYISTGYGYPKIPPSHWKRCSLLNIVVPPSYLVKVFSCGHETNISKHLVSKYTFRDFENNLYLISTDKQVHVYNEEGENLIMSNYSTGKHILYVAPVSRVLHIHTTFNSYFKDHTPGNGKAFNLPVGEAIGIEIEVKFTPKTKVAKIIPDYITKLYFSKWLHDNFPSWICERDGSLEEGHQAPGLEMISPPMTVENLNKELEIILPKCVEMGGVGFKASSNNISYGIHITQNLYGNNKLRDGNRYIYLVNSINLRPFWQAAARRSGPKFDKYSGFQLLDGPNYAMDTQSYDHYRSVYPRDNSAVETRIFRSNLDVSAVKCMIEVCVLGMNYCKNVKSNLDSPSDFKDFLKENGSPLFQQWTASIGGWEALSNNTSFSD